MSSVTLQKNQKCVVKVDATDSVARMTVIPTTFQSGNKHGRGMLIPEYTVNTPYTAMKGGVYYFTFFNGEVNGALRFNIQFSGAVKLSAAVGALLGLWSASL